MIGDLANHLWQSTAFAGGAAALALLFRHSEARVRYWLWLAASIKFLLPFGVLLSIGSFVEWPTAVTPAATKTVIQLAEPFENDLAPMVAVQRPSSAASGWRYPALFILWAAVTMGLSLFRLRSWRRVQELVSSSEPLWLDSVELPRNVSARSARGIFEPGVVGFFRTILLLPAGLPSQLTPKQLEAVVAHELCHAARRDNLTAACHMVVETVFWFHPIVWWIGGRLIDERERACDEHVISACAEPQAYAEGILSVCRRYVETPSPCVAGVGGANLRARIEAIVAARVGARLTKAGRVLLAAALVAGLGMPVAVGALAAAPHLVASRIVPVGLSFTSAGVITNTSTERRVSMPLVQPPGRYAAGNVPLDLLVATAYQPLLRYEIEGVPGWARTARFDIDATTAANATPEEVTSMLRTLLADRFGLEAHWETRQQSVYALTRISGAPAAGLRRHIDDNACSDPALAPPNPARTLLPDQPLPQPPCGAWSGAPALGRLAGQAVTLDTLGRALSGQLGRMVIDRTGLDGVYDLKLEWVPTSPAGAAVRQGSSLADALEQQLGLSLVPRTAPIEVLVIDRLERPRGN